MAKFKKGDKVRVLKGLNAGESGVVVDPWYQPSQSDWPCVIMIREDGTRFSAHHDEMELTEDPSYEYSVQYTIKGRKLAPARWMPKAAAEEWLNNGGTHGFDGAYGPWEKKLVKRKKAGPIEDA